MRFACPHCQQKYELDDKYNGQIAQCTRCKNDFTLIKMPRASNFRKTIIRIVGILIVTSSFVWYFYHGKKTIAHSKARTEYRIKISDLEDRMEKTEALIKKLKELLDLKELSFIDELSAMDTIEIYASKDIDRISHRDTKRMIDALEIVYPRLKTLGIDEKKIIRDLTAAIKATAAVKEAHKKECIDLLDQQLNHIRNLKELSQQQLELTKKYKENTKRKPLFDILMHCISTAGLVAGVLMIFRAKKRS